MFRRSEDLVSYLETLAILAAAERRERARGPRTRLPKRWEGRYILADGRPRAFVAYAHNRADAAADVERQAREALGPAFSSALSYGVERA
jgi:hypothetical protein